jgi:hypothetical protein
MAEVDVAALDEVHDLYRVDPSEFVEARAALVKQLRAEKRVDEARAVVKLRKPTAPSWALDQVAHEEPALIEAALAAGDALQAATTETLDGDASNLRAATDAEGKASAAVIDAAGGHLTLTADHRERMASTLRAAITDDGVRALLVAGLLAADHEPPPMGFAAETTAPAPADAPPSPELPAVKGAAKARLAEAPADEPPARAKRKVRRVGTPGQGGRAAPGRGGRAPTGRGGAGQGAQAPAGGPRRRRRQDPDQGGPPRRSGPPGRGSRGRRPPRRRRGDGRRHRRRVRRCGRPTGLTPAAVSGAGLGGDRPGRWGTPGSSRARR